MAHKAPYTIKGKTENCPGSIQKPEQGQKTIEMCKWIKYDLDNSPNVLNIYIPQSRKNQANKTSNDLSKHVLNNTNSVLPVLHGDKDSSTDPDGHLFKIIHRGVRIIAGLSNKTRLNLLKKIISGWLAYNHLNRVKVYCDEAQKTITPFIDHIYSQLKDNEKANVTPILIDAHLGDILLENKKYKKHFGDKIKHYQNTKDLTEYLFMASMPFVNMEWQNNADILNSITNGHINIQQNDYILWPLSFKKVDQCDEAVKIIEAIPSACLLLVNGDAYHIFHMNDENHIASIRKPKKNCKGGGNTQTKKCMEDTCSTCFPNLDDQELNIVKSIKDKYARGKPFILSGHSCIDRAMTYHTPDMPFTKAFISRTVMIKSCFDRPGKEWDDCSTNKQEDISQMLKRICGSYLSSFRSKGIPLPSVYGPEDIYKGVCDLEKISVLIAGLKDCILDGKTYNKLCISAKNATSITEIGVIAANFEGKKETDFQQPYEYYYKSFGCNGNTAEELQPILSNFRVKIGGERVDIRSINSRLDPKENKRDVTGKYIEDVSKKPLSLTDFKENHDIIKAALNDETKSRVRICYNPEGDAHFVIVWFERQNEFKFSGNNFTVKSIDRDGNCLFNCFRHTITKNTSVLRLRGDVASYIEDHMDKYDSFITNFNLDEIRENSKWNNDISDIVPRVLSDLLEVNVHIYRFNTGLDSGGEELLFDTPVVIPENKRYEKNIYLKHSNGTHYDLFIKH
jgi:hypothetical protein